MSPSASQDLNLIFRKIKINKKNMIPIKRNKNKIREKVLYRRKRVMKILKSKNNWIRKKKKIFISCWQIQKSKIKLIVFLMNMNTKMSKKLCIKHQSTQKALSDENFGD